MKFITVDTYEKLSRQAANIISAQVILRPDSVLGLATGSSPLGTYKQLIEWYEKGDIDFTRSLRLILTNMWVLTAQTTRATDIL